MNTAMHPAGRRLRLASVTPAAERVATTAAARPHLVVVPDLKGDYSD